MPQFISTAEPDFDMRLSELLGQKRQEAADVAETVAAILNDVRKRGDAALIELTAKFDRLTLTPESLAIPPEETAALSKSVTQEDREALVFAAERIRSYHQRQMPENQKWKDDAGAELGWRWTPVASAGLYVPGGLASYPSSVMMNAIPAAVAGVQRLVITVPTPDGQINPLVALAAQLSGVDTIYRIGGAQAIAALAFGTETIDPVDKITGPGNAYVAEAKRQVFGTVGIDMIAGPSEILVIADKHNDPDWIALDLLSQTEHDENAQAVLVTNDASFAQTVAAAVERILPTLARSTIATASWRDFGAVITVRNMGEAAAISDRFAPEHLELCVRDPDALAGNIRHAGAIFLGCWTPEAMGDYVCGPNHVLPTARTARFSSGLSVLDFMKRTTLARLTPQALGRIGWSAERLAKSEGLEAHGMSVSARLAKLNKKTT